MSKIRRGWVVTGAAFVANFVTFGVLFSFGIFLTPIADSFDTSIGPVAPLFSTAVCFYYLAGAVAGRFSDRVGVPGSRDRRDFYDNRLDSQRSGISAVAAVLGIRATGGKRRRLLLPTDDWHGWALV